MSERIEIKQDDDNLLDFKANEEFVSKVLEGELNSYQRLEKWFNEQNLKKRIDKNQMLAYDLILKGYNISKEKNYKIEKIEKENKDLEEMSSISEKLLFKYAAATTDELKERITSMEKNFEILKTQKEYIEKEFEENKIIQKEQIKELFNQKEENKEILQNQIKELENKLFNQKEDKEKLQNQIKELENKLFEQPTQIRTLIFL